MYPERLIHARCDRFGGGVRVELQRPGRFLQRAQQASMGEARPVQRGRGVGLR